MNTRRVAALLREIGALQLELAAAIEQPDEPKRPRRRPLSQGTGVSKLVARPAVIERIGRVMRNKGMTG